MGIKLQEIRRTELALQSLYDCMRKKLSELEPGRQAVIIALEDQDLVLKLMEMGLVKDRQVEVLFRAPFGDPIAIDVNGYVLSLRLEEAALIQVESINEPVVVVNGISTIESVFLSICFMRALTLTLPPLSP